MIQKLNNHHFTATEIFLFCFLVALTAHIVCGVLGIDLTSEKTPPHECDKPHEAGYWLEKVKVGKVWVSETYIDSNDGIPKSRMVYKDVIQEQRGNKMTLEEYKEHCL